MTTQTGNHRGARAIRAAFEAAGSQGRCALVAYLTLGYPSPSDSLELVPALQDGGADIVELGVPFSDPVADGPTIQKATYDALRAGVTPSRCLDLAAQLRRARVSIPLVFMGYYNPIHSYGLEAYVRDCARAGVDGLIVPDLPLEEAAPLLEACRARGLALVLLVAPTTGGDRIARIAAATQGFLYVVARLGTTGGEWGPGVERELEAQLELVRRCATTPIAVGFGISQPGQANALKSRVDGIVVGSAVVERAREGPGAVRQYASSLRDALHRPALRGPRNRGSTRPTAPSATPARDPGPAGSRPPVRE